MNKKQFTVILLSTMVFAFLGGIFSQGIMSGSPAGAQAPGEETVKEAPGDLREYLVAQGLFMGVVQAGRFHILAPQSSSPLAAAVRLTHIQMQEARPPDSAEVNLEEYEGKALMVHGHDGGGWIYKAAVVDIGGPLVTALVKYVFAKNPAAQVGGAHPLKRP
jgi:hypothetical protein